MRYEVMRLMQLLFSLTVMFGAFAAGLVIGWLRWGRRVPEAADPVQADALVPRLVKPDLFSPVGAPGDVVPAAVTPPPLPAGPLPGLPVEDAELVEVDLTGGRSTHLLDGQVPTDDTVVSAGG